MSKNKKTNKTKVIIALSGGVDSAVAAALLKKKGYNVIGVFMKFWTPYYRESEGGPSRAENRCCTLESEVRARKVAKKLNIPFYVFNFRREFKKRIVDYFLREQKAGLTPNPCIICNKEIKFGLLLEKALSLGADFVATGHYARLRREIRNPKSEIRNYRHKLLRAKDKNKDQSYFLWKLNQEQLKHILFPIGNYTRAEVEKLAKKFKLPFSGVSKSMEICFVRRTINEFLKKYLKEKPGVICSSPGDEQKVVGRHQGLWFYTIGQRKGINLTNGPWYVLDKKIKNNLLVVTRNKQNLLRKEFLAKNINWISGSRPKMPLALGAKIRYRHKGASAHIYKLGNKKKQIIFDKSQLAITPGQSVVFYQREEVLGGGIIC